MSLLHEEDFGSDSDDEDYVPENEAGAAEGGSSEELSGDDEDVDGEDGEKAKKGKKKKSKASKKAGSGLFVKSKEEIKEDKERGEEFEKEKEELREENEKKRMDDLWADFKKDAGSKSTAPVTIATPTAPAPSASIGSSVVTKEPQISTLASTTTSSEVKTSSVKATPTTSNPTASSTKPAAGPAPVKRGSGLAGLVSAIADKKKKIGCLEQSKKDWNSFVQETGIREELQTFNRGKDGYVEKQQFLERADLRQFEREREAREKMRKLQNR